MPAWWEYLDMSVGRILDYLADSGQLERTVILFTADHGASSGEQGVHTGRGPTGSGPSPTEDVDNRIENFGRAGSFVDHGWGFGQAATAPFKYLKSSVSEGGLRAAAFVNYPSAIRAGWVGTRAGGTLIRGNRKIVNEPPPGGTESTPWRLYDLAEDPGETRDLAAESPELVAELVREWEANWR